MAQSSQTAGQAAQVSQVVKAAGASEAGAGTQPVDPRAYRTFAEFYPFYLSEHSNRTCRRLHFLGSSLALVCLLMLVLTGGWGWLFAGLVCGYGFAWVGHFVFEKNRPASFKRPLFSFMGDWRLYSDIWRGRIPF